MKTQWAIFRVALRQRRHQLLVLGSRLGLFALVLFVFKQLWSVLLPGGAVSEHVWYLAITEWVTLSQPRVHLDIENDVRGGELTYYLTRPVSYLSFRLAEALAELLIGLAATGVFGLLWAYFLAGGFPADPRGLLWALPLGLVAALLALLFHVVIGLSAFWLLDCSPVYWVWQKAMFVLGGLMLPLTLYPGWLRTLAQATPFAALLSGPGSLAFGLNLASVGTTALHLALWLAVAVLLVAVVYRRGVTRIELHGG
ncbi:MAG: ABC-2 family transporter protein [Polyangiales bacterium]